MNDDLVFYCAKIDPEEPLGIQTPKHEGDCGFDLLASEQCILYPGDSSNIPINARLELPPGYWAEMKPRSSIAKRGLQIDGGILDCGYRGPLWLFLRRLYFKATYDTPVGPEVIEKGERIAQLIFHELVVPHMEEIEEISENTARGTGGFGSTGRH